MYFFPNHVRRGSLRPFLVDERGRRIPEAPPGRAPAPGEARWDASGVLFHCAPGRAIADYQLRGTLAAAGVQISNASYIRVTDLTCEYFANDGFNVHGSCYGLEFERVEARFNGDDGFSVHEDVGVLVRAGWFHGNSYDIQDVKASRSMYCGVLVEGNRRHGVNFVGGFHSLVDSVVRDNAMDQVRIDPGRATHLGMGGAEPMLATTAYVCNCIVAGGRNGICVTRNARVTVRFSLVRGSQTGVLAAPGSVLSLFGTAVVGCTKYDLDCNAPRPHLDANLYFPGRVRWGGRLFPPSPEQFQAYQSASGNDSSSVVREPEFVSGEDLRLTGPVVMRLAVGPVRPGIFRMPAFGWLSARQLSEGAAGSKPLAQ